MIHILDCNTLICLEKKGLVIRAEHECVVPEEILEEFFVMPSSEIWFGKSEFLKKNLDEADYITEYARLLNKYPGVSFFSLRGFGDISALATLSLLTRELPKTPTLSGDLFEEETICLVSGDGELTDFVGKEFPGLVKTLTPDDFAKGV